MADVGFVHLRTHSAYSLLEGALSVGKLLEAAKADYQPAMGLVDTGNLFGALEMSEKATEKGIQPILGCALTVEFGDREDESGRRAPHLERPERLVFLAATERGWENLVRLVSRSYMGTTGAETAHVKPADLEAFAEGLIVLTGGHDGPIDRRLADGQKDLAERRLLYLQGVYGDRLYIEVQRHGMPDEIRVEEMLIDLAYGLGLPLVATNEPFFLKREDYEAHDALISIAEGRVIIEEDRRRLTPEFYFKTRAEMVELFKDLPEAIANTIEIAERCSYRTLKRKPLLPRFAGVGADPEEAERAEAAELRRQAEEGLERRLAHHGMAPGLTREVYDERLAFELSIIERMKFPGYFLIVSDFIKWGKAHGIPVGPGRGSGAGSLVAWVLTITDLDPLRFALLFERFLNPERVSMPDFDIDFCQDRRDEVIRYVQEKYGRDQVAQIITFGSLQARAVLRDVGRVLQMPYGQVDRLAKLVPQNPANPVTLKQAVAEEPKLQEAREAEPIVDKLLDIAMKLEGLYRHASTHAAGIVIGDRPLDRLVPLYRDPRSDMPVTQYNMKWVESAGLVKFDFLGLKTLTVLDTAVKLVARRGISIDLSALPLDDPPTYKLLTRGETVGVFQLESSGMRKAISEIEPDRFEDIIALVALYRPGPMANIPVYGARKHGKEETEYPHPLLEASLKETYGIIVYQEQVMEIGKILSGYSLGEADLLRRAMGKKIKAEMDAQRVRFVDGAVERGVSKSKSNEIFDLLAKFADYGFNKSHAAAYALVAYQTAYMKANYPVEFMAASMTLDMSNTDKLSDFRREAMRLGIEVVPPSVNQSQAYFDVMDGKIIYSMAAVKGVGGHAVEHIVAMRGAKPFKDMADFARRIDPKFLNKRTLESLAAAGAFDCIEKNRARVVEGLDVVLAAAHRLRDEAAQGQGALFGAASDGDKIQLPQVAAWQPSERLQREHLAVGFYLSAHPLDEYRPILERMRVQLWADFSESVKRGSTFGRLAGTVTSRQEKKTKTGNKMGIIRMSDPTGQYEAIIFSEGLGQYRDLLEPGQSIILYATAEERSEGISLRIERVEKLDAVAGRQAGNLRIFMKESTPIELLAGRLEPRGEGEISIVVEYGQGEREVEVKLPGKWRVSPQLAGNLKVIDGVRDVQLV
jgi:DNA polymerase-3 subunit alpha